MINERDSIAFAEMRANGFDIQPMQNEKFGCQWIAFCKNAPRYSCYLRIASSSYVRSQDYIEYIKSLQTISDLNVNEDERPIILIQVNENQQTCMFGILLYWQYGHPFINPKPNFRILNTQNSQWLIDVLKAAHRVLAWLKPNDFKIIKSIQLNDNQYPDSYVVYLRDFSSHYKMAERKQKADEFTRNLLGTPQTEFPSDMLDFVIINLIQKKFPNAQCISSTYLFGIDILKYQHYKTYEHYQSLISVFPGFYAPNSPYLMPLESNAFYLPIDVCYHNNIFKRNWQEKPLFEDEYTILNAINGDFQTCAALTKTYHPLSENWM